MVLAQHALALESHLLVAADPRRVRVVDVKPEPIQVERVERRRIMRVRLELLAEAPQPTSDAVAESARTAG